VKSLNKLNNCPRNKKGAILLNLAAVKRISTSLKQKAQVITNSSELHMLLQAFPSQIRTTYILGQFKTQLQLLIQTFLIFHHSNALSSKKHFKSNYMWITAVNFMFTSERIDLESQSRKILFQ
jgi:hypothetical protein